MLYSNSGSNFALEGKVLWRIWSAPRRLYARLRLVLGVRADAGGDFIGAFRHVRAAARAGFVEAQFRLGGYYERGRGITCSPGDAAEWYRRAALKGHPGAQFSLSLMYLHGHGVRRTSAWYRTAKRLNEVAAVRNCQALFPHGIEISRDYTEALRWSLAAAHGGRLEAQANAGLLLLQGLGCEADYAEAFRWLSMAADKGNAEAQYGMGMLLDRGLGVEKDPAAACRWYEAAAAQDHTAAQAALGYMYGFGEAGNRDPERAKQLLSQASDRGNSAAPYYLGMLLLADDRSADDLLEIEACFLRAAQRAYVPAMVALANFYLRGELGNAATDRAEIWLRAAAETGDAEAQFQLGALYASRSGASSDTAAALRYYRQAAEQGHSSAQHNCAEMLLASGHGRAAAVWFTAAAAQGVAESQLMLGDLYATSRGVPRNLQIARDWYEKAASNGLRSAVAKLERCARLLDMLADPRFAGIDDSTLARTVCSVLMEETSVTQEKEGPWYRIAAEAGDAEAQSILAWALLTGDGCDADAVSSFSWFKRSAEAGFVPAQLQLGIMYRDGVGVPADEDLSSSWIKRAAEAGNDEARALLEPASGAAGAGAEGEPAVVEVPWYRISAEEGDAEAQSILAWACLTGDNCERDAVEAAFWFERSASAGFVPSQLQLGSMYYEGVGVPQRLAEAAAWFRLAAQAGDGQAQFRIASMLWRGEGVASDRAAALDWYRKAAQSGQPDAQVFIESQMPQNSARREGHGESPPPAPPSSPASRSVADSRVEAESVRLVIWDLDDTFWRGTLAEGGIEAYIQKNHDMVVALAERGIMSSICSCNDNGAVRGVLEERGLWQYFIFPSIDWTPKRQRIAAIIEAAQLRPPTVLFVDDNPLHRAAVAAAVPGIQIASPAFLAGMLDDRRFTGKDDRKLSRLAQYKLLETRQVERQATQGGDEEFLRSADIRVIIDTDIAANIDRAIELINRTNQLNFTKRRLPEAPELARAQLRRELSPFYSHACLVRVIDKYGDYGFCGYYRLEGDTLVDYCFSCRILGMGVESWLYERLGRPQVTVAGEVLTDLTQRRRVDWVTLSTNEGSVVAVAERVIPEVRLRGGCELDALAHYFRLVAKAVRSETNRSRAPLFVRMDTAVQLVPALDGSAPSFRDAALRMGFAADDFESQFLAPAAAGSILVYSPWADIYQGVYWHKTEGFRIPVNVHIHSDLTRISDQDLAAAFEDLKLDEAQRAKIISIVETLRSEYRYEFHTPLRIALDIIRRVFERIPAGAQLCFILPHEWYKEGDKLLPRAVKYNQAVRQLASRYSAVTLVSMNDVVHDEGEMQDSFDHFDRVVYFRLYQKIMEAMGVGQVFSSPAVAVS